MKEIINERLKKISAYILNNEKIIDIGCDHALLDIYLCKNRDNLTIVASDINEKPLIKAKENILKYHLEDKIKIVKADGLEALDDNINTIIISGMGTLNIVNILQNVGRYSNISKLVLSPNNDFPLLRCEISKLGFKITKEEMIRENNKYYLICEFTKGEEKINYLFGKLDLSNVINKEYFTYLYNKNKKIIDQIKVKKSSKKKKLIDENIVIRKEMKII